MGRGVDSGADSGTENERSTSDLATVTEDTKTSGDVEDSPTVTEHTKTNGGIDEPIKISNNDQERQDVLRTDRNGVMNSKEESEEKGEGEGEPLKTALDKEMLKDDASDRTQPSSLASAATHITAVLGGVTLDSPSGDDVAQPIKTNPAGFNTPQNPRKKALGSPKSPFQSNTVLSAPSSPNLPTGVRTPDALSYRTPDTGRSRIRKFGPPEKIIDSPVVSMERLNVNNPTNVRTTGANDRSSRMNVSKSFLNEDAEGLEVTMTSTSNINGSSTPVLSRHTSLTMPGNERAYRDAVLRAIDCEKDETVTLSALCFVYSIISSPLVDSNILTAARWLPKKRAIAESDEVEDTAGPNKTASISASPTPGNLASEDTDVRSPRIPTSPSLSQSLFSLSTISYSAELVERAIAVLREGCKVNSDVRQVTLHVAAKVIHELCYFEGTEACLRARHIQKLKAAHDTAQSQVASLYRTHASAMILPMVEAEYQQKELKMHTVLMQPHILLPATNTPMTGIHLNYRIPNGEVERCRKAVHSFLLIRKLYLGLARTAEDMLPLLAEVNEHELLNQQLDLNDADLMSCRVIESDKPLGAHRFLVIDPERLIFVEPDKKQLGWGVVKVASDLQHVEITPDSGNHRVLHVVITSPPRGYAPGTRNVLRVVFEDHLRAAAASQHLQQANTELQQLKQDRLETLLGLYSEDR